ncbi:MAG: hypothetical protein DHS20C20_06140 [Ardenticatenaceae bacterium]|nr:MAG: hypothetical protein DHS20C20_06140 [Ardenticatenaceae bacterium]
MVIITFLVTLIATSVAYGNDKPLEYDAPIFEGDALILDAQNYAFEYDVSLDEALQRLKLQDSIGILNNKLMTNEQNTFAGLWIEHTPKFNVVVQFTQGNTEQIWSYVKNSPLIDILEIREANMSLFELKNVQEAAKLAAQESDTLFDFDINIVQNRVELYVLDLNRFNSNLAEKNVQLPANVAVIKVDALSRETSDIFAGLKLVSPVAPCTSGFSVKNSSGVKGILTAGHCHNNLRRNGINLPFQSEAWAGPYDFQWHTIPAGFTIRNLAYDGTYNRYIYGEMPRSYQFTGEYVCKYGVATFGGCGNIVSTNFNGTFVRVHSDSVDLGELNDSGGPWFKGNIAYGLTTGDIEPGNDAYYMAIDYIDYYGLDVLTN